MDLHRCLQTFTVVVDQGSFNQAAKQLYRSASQISKEISWLEGHFNTTLINRTTRALHITDAGRHCYHTAKKLLSDIDSLKLNLNQQQEYIAGPLTHQLARWLWPALLNQLHYGIYQTTSRDTAKR